MQRGQRRAEHPVHAGDTQIDLARGHERRQSLSQVVDGSVACQAIEIHRPVVSHITIQQRTASTAHPLRDLVAQQVEANHGELLVIRLRNRRGRGLRKRRLDNRGTGCLHCGRRQLWHGHWRLRLRRYRGGGARLIGLALDWRLTRNVDGRSNDDRWLGGRGIGDQWWRLGLARKRTTRPPPPTTPSTSNATAARIGVLERWADAMPETVWGGGAVAVGVGRRDHGRFVRR